MARISNAELDFLETTITDALAIIQDTKALAYLVDDPEVLEVMLRILYDAQDIRSRSIRWMKQRKGEGARA